MAAIWAGPGMSEHCGSADILGPAGRFYPLGRERGKERTDGGLLMRANSSEVGLGKRKNHQTHVQTCRAAVFHQPASVTGAVCSFCSSHKYEDDLIIFILFDHLTFFTSEVKKRLKLMSSGR